MSNDGRGSVGDTAEFGLAAVENRRANELESARKALSEGTGVFVIGAPGSGRTRFVREVVARLDEKTREHLWVGEDLHQLDELQALRLAQAVSSKRMLPLATITARRPIFGALSGLWRDGAVVRVLLEPLTAAALRDVAEQYLGAQLSPAATSVFIPRRGGADLAALHESLSEATRNHSLTRRMGEWQLTGTIAPSEPLRHLLHTHIGNGADGATASTLLDLISLIPGLTLDMAIALGDELHLETSVATELERLEELGAISIRTRNGIPSLRLHDGVVELLMPQTIGTLRRRRLTTTLVDVFSRVPPSSLAPSELVAYARLALEQGRALDGGSLTLAARVSLREADRAVSVELATAAVENGGGFDADMALAAAESQIGDSAAALDRLRRLVDVAQGDAQLGEALTVLTRQVLERAADAAGNLPATPPGLTEGNPRLDALKGFMLFTLGDAAGAAALVEPALGVLKGEELGQAHFVVATGALLSGRLTQAREALDDAETVLVAAGADVTRVQNVRANVAMFDGRIPEALASMEAFRQAAIEYGQPAAEAMCGWMIGGLLVWQGCAPRSVAELRPAIRAMEQIGLSGTTLHARCDLATALALTGDEAAASDALAPCLTPESAGNFGIAGRSRQALGWIHASAGRLDEAGASFVRAADAFAVAGQDVAGLTALVDAARTGSARIVFPRIEALAGTIEGAYAATLVRHARALAAREGLEAENPAGAAALAMEFDEVGELAVEISVHMIAAEAFAHASMLYSTSGDSRLAAASGRRRDKQIAACGLDRLPFAVERGAQILSPREIELATLAAAGLSNREIAAQLVLSVRTVETHLQRVYQKLGVRGRSELSSVLL